MQDRIINLLLFYPVFLFSLSFHEAAHGWMAERFGDRTARLLGRVSLSPFPHIDLIGTVFLPVFGILTGAPVIGWGKPVPVNPYNFKDPRKDNLWVAALGPISNITLAIGFAVAFWGLVFLLPHFPAASLTPGGFVASVLKYIFSICQMGVLLNLMLAFFNLLPLPPLDGGSVLRGLLPEQSVQAFDHFSHYSMMILLLLFVTGLLKYIFIPVFLVASLLLPV